MLTNLLELLSNSKDMRWKWKKKTKTKMTNTNEQKWMRERDAFNNNDAISILFCEKVIKYGVAFVEKKCFYCLLLLLLLCINARTILPMTEKKIENLKRKKETQREWSKTYFKALVNTLFCSLSDCNGKNLCVLCR